MSFTSSLSCESDTTLTDLPPTPGLDLTVWEFAAKQIIRGYDIQDIRLLYRFFPFDDLGSLHALLRNRWVPFLNALLIHIGEDAYGREFVDALSVDQTINEISKWLHLPFSTQESRCEWAWAWTQERAWNETASTIAYNIEKDSCSQFAKIPFQDLIKQALGGDARSLPDFIAEHVCLSIRISRHLREFPEEVPKYAQVQKVSHPLVRIHTDAIY